MEELAHQVIASGGKAPHLILLEAEPSRPYPGHVTMFFGDASPVRNPFLTGSDPSEQWQLDHVKVDWKIVAGDHDSMCWFEGADAVMQSFDQTMRSTEAFDKSVVATRVAR